MTRVLVVDDDAGMRSVISDALRQDGYQVEAVCNGRQALAAFAKHLPDAMVLDLQMPSMDGPSLMRTLREQTQWGAVPFLLVSGNLDLPQVSRDMGAGGCLSKPFELCDLLTGVEDLAAA